MESDNNAAQVAMKRAEALRASWTESSLREAVTEYDRAAQLWNSSSEFKNASTATLKAGDICFLFGEFAEARKRYDNAKALAEKAGDWLARVTALSHSGRLQSYVSKPDLAQRYLREALDVFRQHESLSPVAASSYGEALTFLAEITYARGDFVNSQKQLDAALKILQNDSERQAKIHLLKGYTFGSIGNPEKAEVEISTALELYRAINNKDGEGLALTALGLAYSFRDESKAIALHRQALDIFHTIGDKRSEAVALNALGQAHEILHDYSTALSYYEQSFKIFEDQGSPDAAAMSMFKIATIHALTGQAAEALADYNHCLRLSRAGGNVRTEALAVTEIAKIWAEKGKHEFASNYYQRALQFYERIGDLRGQVTVLSANGDLLFQTGQRRQAVAEYGRAVSLGERVGDKEALLAALFKLARATRDLGHLEDALSIAQRSLDTIENLRASIESPDFRASYFSGVQQHYKLCIDILMRLDRLRPAHGFAQQALIVSEKGRARLLVDLVNDSRANIRHGPAKELVEREHELRALFRSQAQYRLNLALSGSQSAELTDADEQLTQLRAEYQEVLAELSKQQPGLMALEQSIPQRLEQIESELRDSDTMLLEYSLGDERSYLWAITSNSFTTYELPARKVIEDLALSCYKALAARQVAGADLQTADELLQEKGRELSQMLLAPLGAALGNRRLLVTTEGALQLLPFDALPLPAAPERRLVETNEIVVLPSLSTLTAIRKARKHTGATKKLIAIIADPVFSPSDDRVHGESSSAQAATVATGEAVNQPAGSTLDNLKRDGALTRLAHASEEADAISTVAPWGTTMVAKGFAATRETAMSWDVGQYQIVHLATHGFLDDKQPELSGIVLSMVDRNGAGIDGVMALQDIYRMNLSAELTVLSACETGLGKDLKGEGLVGLTHGFLSAGSKSVVASLWKVDDRATAVLMTEFYQPMLQQGLPPAAALRTAKLKMMRDPRWGAPYYWAGFVLQGEYTNQIIVDYHPWRRVTLIVAGLLLTIAAVVFVFYRRSRAFSPPLKR